MARLFSYIVARDYGFAPNPFYGFCTLATCKPQIRKNAETGDWIIGTGSKSKGRAGFLVYAMRVSQAMSFDEYWNDPRFRNKRPNLYSSMRNAFGDNIYHRERYSNQRIQIDSHHSKEDGTPNLNNICNDTKVDRILVSDDFIYWGGGGPLLPTFCEDDLCCKRQGHRCHFPEDAVREFITWIRGLNDSGYCGVPLEWA